MRYIYPTQKGSKPLIIGMNHAKRVARRADERDQETVLAVIGPGGPRQHSHHQTLVRSRHRYYREVEATERAGIPFFPHESGAGPRETARRVRQMVRDGQLSAA